MKKMFFLFLILGLLTGPWTGQAETWQDSFQKQVKEWAKQLESQDKRFSSLAEASFKYGDLGPNSHQWLVTFYLSETPIGYMVVGEGPDGFHLLEYGLGEYTLFEPTTVTPFRNGVEKLTPRFAGLQSVWTSDSFLYDAKSGEKYPADTNEPEADNFTSRIKKGSALKQVIKGEHPGDSIAWIKPEKELRTQEDLINELGHAEISLIAHFFRHTVTAPFQVVGCHIWDEELFVELDDYGSRYVPFQHAAQLGKFVQ